MDAIKGLKSQQEVLEYLNILREKEVRLCELYLQGMFGFAIL